MRSGARMPSVEPMSAPDQTCMSWRALLALENPQMKEFDDPALEGRRLLSELLGTFLLVMAGAGGAVVGAASHGDVSRTAAVTGDVEDDGAGGVDVVVGDSGSFVVRVTVGDGVVRLQAAETTDIPVPALAAEVDLGR